MTASEETAARPQRRVGTFTLGVVLVAAGGGMLVSLFWPVVDLGWLLKASPVILIILGVEVLLAARGGGKVKYDWLGMLLCFLLVGAGLTLYAAAWYVENGEYFNAYDCARWADETGYRMSYDYFDGFDSHTLRLEAGDALEGRVDTDRGWLEVEISGEDGETICEGSPLHGEQHFAISESGEYTILVHGTRARGSFRFDAVPAAEAPPAPEEAEDAEAPEELPETAGGETAE